VLDASKVFICYFVTSLSAEGCLGCNFYYFNVLIVVIVGLVVYASPETAAKLPPLVEIDKEGVEELYDRLVTLAAVVACNMSLCFFVTFWTEMSPFWAITTT